MRKNDDYYRSIEERLRALLETVSGRTPLFRTEEIREFVDYSEYGVALKWLADTLVELGEPIGPELSKSIVELAEVMGTIDEMPIEIISAASSS